MTGRAASFVRSVTAEFGGFRVVLGPQGFLFILDVPPERLCEVEDRAWQLAHDFYAAEPVPYLISAVSPKNTPAVEEWRMQSL